MSDHHFAAADAEAECPTCRFPAWAHDPGSAFLYGRRILAADSLDAAWAEAEAALPEWWSIHLVPHIIEPDQYTAEARSRDPFSHKAAAGLSWADGPTPTAALRALAAKLREREG